jgi:hypothetical protein
VNALLAYRSFVTCIVIGWSATACSAVLGIQPLYTTDPGCIIDMAEGTECVTCLQGACATELGGVEKGCEDYLSCVCPGGTYSASDMAICAPMATAENCTRANESLTACRVMNCAPSCAQHDGGAS